MKVLLVYPNQDRKSFLPMIAKHRFVNIHPRPKPMISLGMLYLVSAIKDVCEVRYIDNNIQKHSTSDLVKIINELEPDIVGFGGTLTEWTQAKDIAKQLSCITIYGGPNASANPQKHVKHFDYVFRGWAEKTLRKFILAMQSGIDIDCINGVCWYGDIVNACLDIDINSINLPARDIIDINSYKRSQFSLQGPCDIIVASRGCPFSCKFCSSKSIWNQAYKMREVGLISAEIEYMRDTYGTKTFHFREDNLTVNKMYLESLCRELKDLKVDWICQSRVNALDKSTVEMMKASGCKVICCGFESANDSTLQYIDKGFHFEDVVKTIEILEECKMHYSGGFMVGVLNEGEEEIKNTLDYVKRVSKFKHSLIPRGAGRFVGWPTSSTYNEIIDNNLIAYNWEDGEQLIPHTYKLKAHQVENCIARYS